jgi:hypothetical protein
LDTHTYLREGAVVAKISLEASNIGNKAQLSVLNILNKKLTFTKCDREDQAIPV